MSGIKTNPEWKALWILLAIAGGVLSITEEFYDPHYLFLPKTIRLVEAAGFRFEEHFGSLWVYTANFRRKPQASYKCR